MCETCLLCDEQRQILKDLANFVHLWGRIGRGEGWEERGKGGGLYRGGGLLDRGEGGTRCSGVGGRDVRGGVVIMGGKKLEAEGGLLDTWAICRGVSLKQKGGSKVRSLCLSPLCVCAQYQSPSRR